MSAFQRPINQDFPKTWHEFTGKSGRKFWVQDIPDDYKEIVTNYIVYGFAKEEPLCKFSLASTYPNFLNGAAMFWRQQVNQNLSLVCLTKNECEETQIVGVSCMSLSRKDEEKSEDKVVKKSATTKIIETHTYMQKKADAFDKLNISECLSGIGLYVLPEFRGEGIGLELLKAREPFCKAFGLKTVCTVFTSKFSQIIAEKAGFKDLYSITYEELAKINKELLFPGIENHSTSIRCMYKQYE